jgi:DNA-binding response OmpR family regulator
MPQILIIEDDRRLGENLKVNLELRQYSVDLAPNLQAARGLLQTQRYDACLIDVELPDGNGLDFCQAVRALDPEIPIIMITARIEESAALSGLQAGADDYVRKPFGTKELALRLEKLLQRRPRLTPKLCLEELVIDLDTRKASYAGRDMELGKKELELLQVFMANPGRVFSRDALLQLIDREHFLQGRTIDSHISHLRKKLSAVGCQSFRISSVYGEGYRLEKVVE